MNQLDIFDIPAGLVRQGLSIVPPRSLDNARALADAGIAKAAAHADAVVDKWTDLAYVFLVRFCKTHATFISEDVSDASKEWGMVQPPTDRAWGIVYRRAVKQGFIQQCGVGRSRRRHGSVCIAWKSMLV